MLEKIKKNGDLISSIFVCIFFLVTLVMSKQWINAMPYNEFDIGPFLYPQTVCAIGVILMTVVCIKKFRMSKAELVVETAEKDALPPTYLVMIGAIVVCGLYIWGMQKIGFLLASVMLLVLLQLITGNRSPVKIALITLGLIIVTYLFFCVLMKLQLPRGKGIFKEFSLIFY